MPAIKKPNQHFDVALQTGTGAAASFPMPNGMAPDFGWLKSRSSGSANHVTTNRLVPNGNTVFTNTTAAEISNPEMYFDGNNIGMQPYSSNAGQSGQAYVLYGWKAGGGTAVTNTSGTTSSQVSANPTAGFSIVTYTGTGSAASIGHGLGAVPQMIIIFERYPGGDDHIVYHASLTSNLYSIRLNTGAAEAGASGAYWNASTPTSTTFSVGTSGESNGLTATYVAYCFAPVAGYSAFGKYRGNGSTDGPFVYLGFRPKWILIRSLSNLRDWLLYDTSSSNPNNPGSDGPLVAGGTDVTSYDSSSYTSFDILSNGFKIRAATTNLNASSETHIYAAFAEAPFKFANGR
jgi:hypothetical protein